MLASDPDLDPDLDLDLNLDPDPDPDIDPDPDLDLDPDPDLDLDPDPDPGDQGLARHFVVGRGYSAVVDRQTYNGKAARVAGELSSRESTFCADSCFAIRSIPALPQQRVKDPKCR